MRWDGDDQGWEYLSHSNPKTDMTSPLETGHKSPKGSRIIFQPIHFPGARGCVSFSEGIGQIEDGTPWWKDLRFVNFLSANIELGIVLKQIYAKHTSQKGMKHNRSSNPAFSFTWAVTLLEINIYHTSRHFWVDDFPNFPRWIFVNSLEGIYDPDIGVHPQSSIFIGFSIINHPFWGTPIFGKIMCLPNFLNLLKLDSLDLAVLHTATFPSFLSHPSGSLFLWKP